MSAEAILKDPHLRSAIKKAKSRLVKAEPLKVTHIYHQERHLKTIPNIKSPHTITHAYLQHNEIERISNLSECLSLTFLNLQENKITKIENINHLACLKRLFLGGNYISVVENMTQMRDLEELYIERQHLEANDQLVFDPRSIVDIGMSLRILDVSSNGLTTLEWIKPLYNLNTLFAKNNRLDDYEDVADHLCVLFRLNSVYVAGNPMVKKHRCMETLIARCLHLKSIDGKDVSDVSKEFLARFDKVKRERATKRVTSSQDIESLTEKLDYDLCLGPQSFSALTMKGPDDCKHHKVVSRSANSLVPRCFLRNKSLRKPIPPPKDIDESFLPRNSLIFDGDSCEPPRYSFLYKSQIYAAASNNAIAQKETNERGDLKKIGGRQPMPMKFL